MMEVKTDGLLAHDWGESPDYVNHGRVTIVYEELTKLGLKLWFDKFDMAGNLRNEMTVGIETTNCVLVFITGRYQDKVNSLDPKDNCYFEFNFACFRLTSKRIIPVVIDPEMRNTQKWKGRLAAELATHLHVEMSEAIEKHEAKQGDDLLKSKCQELYDQILKIKSSSFVVSVSEGEKFIQLASRELDWIKPCFDTIDTEYCGNVEEDLRVMSHKLSKYPIMNKLLQSLDFDTILFKILEIQENRQEIMSLFLLLLPKAEGDLIETILTSFLAVLNDPESREKFIPLLKECKFRNVLKYLYQNLDRKTGRDSILKIKLRIKIYNTVVHLCSNPENKQVFLAPPWNLLQERDAEIIVSVPFLQAVCRDILALKNDESLGEDDFNRFDDDLLALLIIGWSTFVNDGDIELMMSLCKSLRFLHNELQNSKDRFISLKVYDSCMECYIFCCKNPGVYSELIIEMFEGMRVFDNDRLEEITTLNAFPNLIVPNKTNTRFLGNLYHLLVCDRSCEDEDRSPVPDQHAVLADLITRTLGQEWWDPRLQEWCKTDYSEIWKDFKEILEDCGSFHVAVRVINSMKMVSETDFHRWIRDTPFFSSTILNTINNPIYMEGLESILLNGSDGSSSSPLSSDEIAMKALLLLLEIRKENLDNMAIWSKLKEILSTIENSQFISEVLQRIIDLTTAQTMSYRQFYKLEFHDLLITILKNYRHDLVMVDKVMEVMSLFFVSKNELIRLNELKAMNVVFEVILNHYTSNELPVIETFLGLLVKEDTSAVVETSILETVAVLLHHYSQQGPHSFQEISFFYDFLFEYTQKKDLSASFHLLSGNQVISVLVNNLSMRELSKVTFFLLSHIVKQTPGIDQLLLDQEIIATLVDLLIVKFSRFPEGVKAILNFIVSCPFFVNEFCTALDTKITGLLAFFYNQPAILTDLLTLILKFDNNQLNKLRADQVFAVVFHDVLINNFKIFAISKISLDLQILAKIINPEYLKVNEFYWEVLSKTFTNSLKYKPETLKAIFLASVNDVVTNQITLESIVKLVGMGCTAKVLASMKLEKENLALIKPHLPLIQMKGTGASATDLRALSCTINELFTIGYSALELTKADFSAAEMFSVGYSLSTLREIKFPLKNLRKCCTVEELRAEGYQLTDFKAAEFPVIELKQWYLLADFKSAGYFYPELSSAGFSSAELAAVGLHNWMLFWDPDVVI
jgi:hypothetical protein